MTHRLQLTLKQNGKAEHFNRPPGRVGLPPGVHIQRRTATRSGTMAGALQLRAPPPFTWGSTADESSVTDVMAEYI